MPASFYYRFTESHHLTADALSMTQGPEVFDAYMTHQFTYDFPQQVYFQIQH